MAHGSLAGAPPPEPPAGAAALGAGVAHGSLSDGAWPPPCCPPPYDEPPERWVRVTLAVAYGGQQGGGQSAPANDPWATPQGGAPQGGGQSAPAGDPWATPGVSNDEPPF